MLPRQTVVRLRAGELMLRDGKNIHRGHPRPAERLTIAGGWSGRPCLAGRRQPLRDGFGRALAPRERAAVDLGLGRIVALSYHSSTLYHIRQHIRYIFL